MPKQPTKQINLDHQDKILTVDQYLELVNQYIKPLNFSIIGEVSSVSDRAGATVFFSLSDEHEKAVIDCVIWRNIYRSLGFKLEQGMQVKITGHPNIYKPRGSFSYVVRSIIPTGEGALLKAYEQLKQKLQKQGWFDPDIKRKLPPYITKIGLITADNSDAKKDFETHIGNFGPTLYFADVRVEGFSAVDNVVNALKFFNQSLLDLDVLVITRGGGSLESLQAFNSEKVAKAIHSSRIPVLSAIGHERDVTIADMVADVRGSTPTDAGKIISKDWREAQQKIQLAEKQIFDAYSTQIQQAHDNLNITQERLIGSFQKHLTREQNLLKTQVQKLFVNFKGIFYRFGELDRDLKANILRYQNYQKQAKNHLQDLRLGLTREGHRLINTNAEKVKQLESLLESANPNKKLKQGYTITRNSQGKIIKSTDNLEQGAILNTQLADGNVDSTIDKINKI
jgi:exodeoxyribonuclease VII large subunit